MGNTANEQNEIDRSEAKTDNAQPACQPVNQPVKQSELNWDSTLPVDSSLELVANGESYASCDNESDDNNILAAEVAPESDH